MPFFALVIFTGSKRDGGKGISTFSPEHSYIRFQDDSGDWYNLELTNGRITSDSWVSGSGYVKAEAIKNEIYIDTLNLKHTIAYCLSDLAKGYTAKYWYDEFVLQTINKALEHYPNNIYALQIKSDYYTYLFFHVHKQLGNPTPEQLGKYPDAVEILNIRDQMYDLVDRTGYEDMPEEAYIMWLKSLEQEKQKQEHEKQYFNIRKKIGF